MKTDLNYWVMHPVARVSIKYMTFVAYGGFYIYILIKTDDKQSRFVIPWPTRKAFVQLFVGFVSKFVATPLPLR
jgi:hypothetical protein